MHKRIQYISFPNMYHADFLEILWLLKREAVRSRELNDAIQMLRDKRLLNGNWRIKRQIRDLIIPLGKANHGNDFVTKRAQEVFEYYTI